MATVTLTAKDGHLCLPTGEMLIYRYRSGDVDTFDWPLRTEYRDDAAQRKQIVICVLDEREMGNVPVATRSVTLPDGTELALEVPDGY